MSRMFWFLVGMYAGYRISTRYDVEKLLNGAKKEMSQDQELQRFFKTMNNIRKELRRKEEED
jgi:hypothetical protein